MRTVLSGRGSERPGAEPTPEEMAVARWTGENGRAAGRGTETHADATVTCLPIATGQAICGVLALRPARRLQGGVETHVFLGRRSPGRSRSRSSACGSGRRRAPPPCAVRAEEMRTSLLSAVSHDLRTPLAAITGAGTALRLDPERLGADRQAELVDTICDEAGRMDRLIGNILDMVRLEAGSTAARREWVPLEEVVGPALARLEDRLAGREVTVDLPADLPLIPVDPVLFEHLLFNLVENAVKHTPPAIPIEVRHGGGGWVEIEVADRGPGLPPGEEKSGYSRSSTAARPPGGRGWDWGSPSAAASPRSTTGPSRRKTGPVAARRFGCGFRC